MGRAAGAGDRRCDAALDDPATPPGERLALLDLRAESRVAIGDANAALADAETMQRAAAEARDLPSKALALWRGDDDTGGLRAAQAATALFEKLGDTVWQGRSQWSQACALAGLGRRNEQMQTARDVGTCRSPCSRPRRPARTCSRAR